MNRIIKYRSIFWGVVIFLAAACGPGEKPREEAAAVTKATPESGAGTLEAYREKGIEPRRARFAREWED